MIALLFVFAAANADPATDARINDAYVKNVRPIFKAKCFDCHSDQVTYPWYHAIPGISWWMDHHIEEGKEELDLSKDWPFKGKSMRHGFDEIWEEIESDDMPLLSYRLIHWDSKLTDAEKTAVKQWIDEATAWQRGEEKL